MDLYGLRSSVVIPAYKPSHEIINYVKELCVAGFWVVVIDDGSGAEFSSVFAALASVECCIVLHHPYNMGKGCALKTGFHHLSETKKDIKYIITADADGQHVLSDVKKVLEAVIDHSADVYLGTRDFSLSHVPSKSRMGNRITSAVFLALYGVKCPDTQTGLRAFSVKYLPLMEKVKGERYEYEMNMLIALARADIDISFVPIETVYNNNNEGSHFHVVRDSFRIYKVILGQFLFFLSSSITAAGIDMIIYSVLFDVFENAGWDDAARIASAKVIARIISAAVNFLINRNAVFKHKSSRSRSLLRYAMVCVLILAASVGMVTLLKSVTGINERILSPIVDVFLFFLSYRIQSGWVFVED